MTEYKKEDQERAEAVVETIWRALDDEVGDMLGIARSFTKEALYAQIPLLKDVFVAVRGG